MRNKKQKINKDVMIYQARNGAIEMHGDFKNETVWASIDQIADVFDRDKSVISRHLHNIYKDKELDKKATVAKNATVQLEGNRKITRYIEYYNLDVIISVGYRVNSKVATEFRKWATKTLREYITKGYVINRKKIQNNHQGLLKTIETLQNILPEHTTLDQKAILELIKEFSNTWVSLDAYDKETLKVITSNKKSIKLSAEELSEAISNIKKELIKKGEATDIFAQERNKGSIEGIVGNVMQSFNGQELYKTLEEKASHLLYFMVKNHPFVDGNKRSGAFAFIWFLRKAKIKGFKKINSGALTALTLLIAESKPEKKDQMVALVTQMLT